MPLRLLRLLPLTFLLIFSSLFVVHTQSLLAASECGKERGRHTVRVGRRRFCDFGKSHAQAQPHFDSMSELQAVRKVGGRPPGRKMHP